MFAHLRSTVKIRAGLSEQTPSQGGAHASASAKSRSRYKLFRSPRGELADCGLLPFPQCLPSQIRQQHSRSSWWVTLQVSPSGGPALREWLGSDALRKPWRCYRFQSRGLRAFLTQYSQSASFDCARPAPSAFVESGGLLARGHHKTRAQNCPQP